MIISRKLVPFTVALLFIIVLIVVGCQQRTGSTSGGQKADSPVDQDGSRPTNEASPAPAKLMRYFAKARITTGIEGSGECGSIAEYTVNLHGDGRVSGKIKLHDIDFLTCKPKKERVLTLYGKHFPAKTGGGTLKAGTIENGKKSGIFLDGSYQGEMLSMTGSHNEGVIGAVSKMKIFVEDLPKSP